MIRHCVKCKQEPKDLVRITQDGNAVMPEVAICKRCAATMTVMQAVGAAAIDNIEREVAGGADKGDAVANTLDSVFGT